MNKRGGEEGEGEIDGESSMDAYTLTYVNRRTAVVKLFLGFQRGLDSTTSPAGSKMDGVR